MPGRQQPVLQMLVPSRKPSQIEEARAQGENALTDRHNGALW